MSKARNFMGKVGLPPRNTDYGHYVKSAYKKRAKLLQDNTMARLVHEY